MRVRGLNASPTPSKERKSQTCPGERKEKQQHFTRKVKIQKILGRRETIFDFSFLLIQAFSEDRVRPNRSKTPSLELAA